MIIQPQGVIVTMSLFLHQIGFVNNDNRRSCRSRKTPPPKVQPGQVYGEVTPTLTKEELHLLMLKYEQPGWTAHLKPKISKESLDTPGSREMDGSFESVEKEGTTEGEDPREQFCGISVLKGCLRRK
jgi:hypothetical protein